jgi:hypothetical protein
MSAFDAHRARKGRYSGAETSTNMEVARDRGAKPPIA